MARETGREKGADVGINRQHFGWQAQGFRTDLPYVTEHVGISIEREKTFLRF